MVNTAFDVLDSNKDGKVDIADMKAKYNPSRHPAVLEGRKADKQVLEEFASTFELFISAYELSEKDGTITRDEFVEFHTNISACIDSDEYFSVLMKNTWNLEANIAGTSSPSKKQSGKGESAEVMKYGGESKSSPFKKTIAESSAEQSLVKEVQKVNTEAPYYTELEEQKKTGNVVNEKMLEQKTENLVLGRFRNAVMSRGVRGLLGIARQFKIYTKNGLLELADFIKAVGDFRLSLDPKVVRFDIIHIGSERAI